MSNSLQLHGAHQAPLYMEFSRQAYWSGLPFPTSGDLPDPGIEPRSPTLWADSLPSEPPGRPKEWYGHIVKYYADKSNDIEYLRA